MNPRVIDDMSWAMAEVYGAVTDKLLVNLARHFKYTKTDNGGTFTYMAQKLAELGQVRKESVDIIMQNLTGADDMLRIVLENAIGYVLKDVEPELKAASVKGMLNPAGMVPELTPNQTRAFKAYYAQSADKLNLVNTVMLESTEAAYQATVSDIVNRVSRSQSLLNIATGEVVSGASSWNSAVRDAVKGMVENGLTGFIDHGGHRWRPETYVAMDVRTTAFNTAREAVMERNESYGNDLYQVSSHNGARPLCYPWQGKIISSADASREVEDLDGNKVHVYTQSETSYGQAAGLFGVNCGHYPIPFIPGFSRLRGSGQSEEDNAKAYAESQEQRKLERKVRKEKLDLDVMKAQGASAEEIAAQKQRVRNAQADVSAFCEQTGRARHRDREFLPVDAKWDNAEKALTKTAAGDRISERENQPRQRDVGNYGVDWPKVQSPEYSAKFRQLTPDEKVATAIETRAKWALNNRTGKDTEELYAIDLRTGKEVAAVRNQNTHFGIQRTKQFTRNLAQADQSGNDIMLIHNHPQSLPPSTSDINALLKTRHANGIIAGHDGSVYYYTRPVKPIPDDAFSAALRKYGRYSERTNIMKALEYISGDYGFTVREL